MIFNHSGVGQDRCSCHSYVVDKGNRTATSWIKDFFHRS